MKDNDIREMFENATDMDEDTNIDSQKIQNMVLSELGKTAIDNLTHNRDSEEVAPIFVQAPAKKFPKAAVITAAATAACLGVVSVSTGFFGLAGKGVNPLSSNSDPAQLEILIMEETAEYAAKEYLFRKEADQWIYLLDQSYYQPGYGGSAYASYLLSEEEGRVYFIKRAEQPDILTDAPKEDITDLISYEDYYLYSYQNPYDKADHYIIAGGSIAHNDYGYTELYKSGDKWSWSGCCSGDRCFAAAKELTDTASDQYARSKWLLNGIKEVEKISGEDILGNISDENPWGNFGSTGWRGCNDFKNVSVRQTNPFGIRLLDGTEVDVVEIYGNPSGISYAQNNVYLLSEEKGRLYFVKNAGDIDSDHKDQAIKEDITDKINSDGYFIYAYNNYYNKEYHTQYVVVGGDIENNDYGYTELFKCDGIWNSQSFTTFGSHNDQPQIPQWLENAITDIEQSYSEQISDNLNYGTGQGGIDFKNLWSIDDSQSAAEYKDPLQPDNPDNEETAALLVKSNKFTLKDGTEIEINGDDVISSTDFNTAKWLLREDNGSVYFYGNDREEDITDIISTGKPYITSYENPESGVTHYIAAGGSPSAGSYGYAEFFKLREGQWEYQMVQSLNPNPMSMEKPNWLQQAIDELSSLCEEECKFRGGAQYVDLENVTAPDIDGE